MEKIHNQLNIQVERDSIVDEGDGVVSFPNGLTITDNSVQRNGTRYDIDTMDLSKYGEQITADHEDKLSNIIAQAIGTQKSGGKVIIEKIRYAINENPYARLAYSLLVNGFSKNFSIETIGTPPDSSGTYYNAELVGLSQVVVPNNYNATVNQLVHNSLERSKEDGLDVEGIEESLKEKSMDDTKTQKTEAPTEEVKNETEVVEDTKAEVQTNIDNSETSEVVENSAEEEAKVETEEAKSEEEAPVEKAEETEETQESEVEEAEVESKEEVSEEETEVETEVAENSAEEVKSEEKEINKETQMEDKKTEEVVATVDNSAAIAEALKAALAPLVEKVEKLEKNAFDASAKEPEFKKAENEVEEKAENAFASMDYKERYQAQVDAAWNAVKLNSIEAHQKLQAINQVNLDALKAEGIAHNSMTLADLGNFVIPPEMQREIVGHRNDYSAILNATEWKETLSIEFAWLKRVGDIDMQNVAFCDDDADGNLKPISEYSAAPQKSELEELAAVTVVCTAATRFAAVDLLGDAAQGYRTDYDRKRAQLVIAKLEQAVDATGQSVAYAPATDVEAMTAWLEAVTEVSDVTLNGTLIFNQRTFAELKARALSAGVNGPLSQIFTTGSIPTVFGYNYIVVPNDLMPTLGGSDTVTHYVDGAPVVINHAVFFADLTVFTGRTSGGLQYDVSNQAPYEVGGVTKSAYQRNELVLRGSFFRGGAVVDDSRVAGIRQGSTNVS